MRKEDFVDAMGDNAAFTAAKSLLLAMPGNIKLVVRFENAEQREGGVLSSTDWRVGLRKCQASQGASTRSPKLPLFPHRFSASRRTEHN
jgi:hypothetical protein